MFSHVVISKERFVNDGIWQRDFNVLIKRTLVISDIHGFYDAFIELLDDAEYCGGINGGDQLIILGDMIDRGVDSFKVLDHVRKLQKEFGKDWVVVVLGNHEQMFLDAYVGVDRKDLEAETKYRISGGNNGLQYFQGDNSDFALWLGNGGRATIESFKVAKGFYNKVCGDIISWLKEQRYIYTDSGYTYVHAGLAGGVALCDQLVNDVVWIRDEFILDKCSKFDNKTVVFGHTPVRLIFNYYIKDLDYNGHITYIDTNKLAIDTGVYTVGLLSCLEIDRNVLDDNVSSYSVDVKKKSFEVEVENISNEQLTLAI